MELGRPLVGLHSDSLRRLNKHPACLKRITLVFILKAFIQVTYLFWTHRFSVSNDGEVSYILWIHRDFNSKVNARGLNANSGHAAHVRGEIENRKERKKFSDIQLNIRS